MCGKNKNLLILSIVTFAFCAFSLLNGTANASTGVNPDISFEGKIVNSSGVNITNATYNVEFTMYTGCSNEPTNNTGCTLAWTEDYLTSSSEGVAFNGGTFQVNLGQYCSFAGGSCQGNTNSGINWNTYPIYMSMQIGETTNCTPSGNFTTNCVGDSVMQPYILMTSTPYAQNAGTLGGLAAGSFAQLAIGSQTFTGSNTFEDSTASATAFQVENNSTQVLLNVNTSATPSVNIGATNSLALADTVNIGTSSGAIQTTNIGSTDSTSTLTLNGGVNSTTGTIVLQDAASGYIVIGSTTAANNINIGATGSAANADSVNINNSTAAIELTNIGSTDSSSATVLEAGSGNLALNTGTSTGDISLTTDNAASNIIAKSTVNNTTALEVQNASGTDILNVDTTNTQVDIGAITAPGSLTATQAPIAGTATGSGSGTSYTYEITAVSANGAESLGSTETEASNGAVLSTNPITINYTTNGASYYKIYRTASGGTPSSTGLIGTSTTSSFVDNGYSGGATAPALANTGTMAVSTNYYYEVTALDDTYTTGGSIGQSNPSTQLTATTNTYNKSLTINWAPVNGARGYNVYRTTTSGTYTTDSYYTVYTNSFTDTNTGATGTNTVPPTTSTAYANTLSDNPNANVTIGDNGTETAQLYVGGSLAVDSVINTGPGSDSCGVAVQGYYAYVTNYSTDTFQVYNVANPDDPILLNSQSVTGACGVSIEGQYAYVIDYSSSYLDVFNISNPTAPLEVSSVPTNTTPTSLDISGRYAYITNAGTNTLQIFDLSNPLDPVVADSVTTGAFPNDVYVQGSYAYVINTNDGTMQIFNVSNPTNIPAALSTSPAFTVGSDPQAISVQGAYAYVAENSASEMQVFDISNPYAQIPVGSFTTGSQPSGIYVQGRYAYLAEDAASVQTVDISNPADPLNAGSVGLGTQGGTGRTPDIITVQGRYAYMLGGASGNNLQIIDLGGAYVQQLQVGGAEVGTLAVDSNANISGDESITGGLSVGGSTQLDSNVGVGGDVTIGGSSSVNNSSTTTQQLYVAGNSNPIFASQSTNANLSNPDGMAVSGDYAYVTSPGNNELVSYDISSGTPVYVGETGTNIDNPFDVYVSGDYAYVTNIGSGQLSIYNIASGIPVYVNEIGSDLLSPTIVNVQGDYAYVVNSSNDDLVVFNISNPADPIFSGVNSDSHDTGSYGLYVQGNYAYVTSYGNNELVVYDIASGIPVYVSENNADLNYPTGVFVQGNYAYVANVDGNNIVSFNIASGTPVLVGENTDANMSGDDWLYVQGNYLYVDSQNGNKLGVYDVSSGTPVYVGENGDSSLNLPSGLSIQGNYAYVSSTDDNTLVRFNLGGTYSQQLQAGGIEVGQLQVDTNENVSGSVTIAGGLAVTSSVSIAGGLGVNGNLTVAGAVPTSATGTVTTGNTPYSVYVQGGYAYVVNEIGNTLQIIDISNPASPVVVGTAATQTNPYYVYVQGRYAYVTNFGSNSLQIFDVSNPSSPASIGSLATGGGSEPSSVYVSGSYAYVLDEYTSTIQVVNISNPANPVSVGSVSTGTGNYPDSIYVQGNYAYVTAHGNADTFQIFNISNPAFPVAVSDVDPGPDPSYVYVQGNYAYVTYQYNGMNIYNISNPANPVSTSNTAMSGLPVDVYVQGNYAYVVNQYNDAVQIMDISNPASPTTVGSVTTNTNPNSIFVQGNYAYVVNEGTNNLQIFNLGGAYIQQLQAGGIQVSTLSVSANAQVSGDESITGGLNVGSSAQVVGNASLGGLDITDGLTTPTIPSLTVTCSGTCGTSYNYVVTAVNASGSSAESPEDGTAVGNATLNTTTEYNRSTWSAVAGATSYNLYRVIGGSSQGLIGTVNYTTALTPTSGSETGATLTLNFASAPPWVVGQAITLASFTTTAVNGTWPILSVTATSITVNILAGSTRAITVGPGTATGLLAFYDTGQTAGSSAPTAASAGTISLQTTSTVAFQVENSSSVAVLTADTLDNIVIIGSNNSANNTQTLLQLNSDSTLSEVATCSTSVDQGALYYNNASNNIRACIDGSWQDLVSTQALALQLFGVVPNSGTNPGDLIGSSATATAFTGGPCKVTYSSTTSVNVAACFAYSGGREVSVAAKNVPIGTVAAGDYENICLNSSGVPTAMGGVSATDGAQTAANLSISSATTLADPLLCLATIKSTTANDVNLIYDIRTFTTTTKTYGTLNSATQVLGGLVMASTAGLVANDTAATSNVVGVLVAGNNVAETVLPNVIYATGGPQWIKGTAGTQGDYLIPTATVGYASASTTTVATAYDQLGVNQAGTYESSCSAATFGATDCQASLFTHLEIQ